MLKISEVKIELGTQLYLPEKWHDKLLKFNKSLTNCPYNFVVSEERKKGKTKYYVCVSTEKGKKQILSFSEYTAKYLMAQEVPDSNLGFSFKEYLPYEQTAILITNEKNPNEVVPAIFEIDVEMLDESIITFSFKLNYMNGNGFSDISHYDSVRKSTWKSLDGEEMYMSDYEKMFKDTIIHKRYVTNSVNKLASYLDKIGATNHASKLRERAISHDLSKISYPDEMRALSRIINDKRTLKDVNQQLSPIQKDAIALHHKHNTHHPEHFNNAEDMEKLDIMEMCCDWHARSTQYGTNFIEYATKASKERFHFSDHMFTLVMYYCEILDSKY